VVSEAGPSKSKVSEVDVEVGVITIRGVLSHFLIVSVITVGKVIVLEASAELVAVSLKLIV